MQTGSQSSDLPAIRGGSWTRDELREGIAFGELECVRFSYCLSFVVVTLRYQSPAFAFSNPQNRLLYGLLYSFVSLVFGLWGLPWGPIWTLQSIWVNLTGGIDAQEEIADWVQAEPVRVTPQP